MNDVAAEPWLPPGAAKQRREKARGRQRPKGLRSILRQAFSTIAFFVMLMVLLLAILWNEVVITVPPGHVGVLWLRFFDGTVIGRHLSEGLHVILPWDRIYIYNARPQRTDVAMSALSNDGLAVDLDLTVTTVIDTDTVGYLHKAVGPDYTQVVVEPIVVAAVRELIAGYAPDQIYQVARDDIEPQLARSVNQRIETSLLNAGDEHQLIRVSQLSVRDVRLPSDLRRAIEEKLSAEQAALRYQYILERERLESDRKAIEADGIRRFQEIVTPAISDEYLRWRGIDATLQLAQSANSKVVVIGGGADGLPIILDGTGAASSAGDVATGATARSERPVANDPAGGLPAGRSLTAARPSSAASSGRSATQPVAPGGAPRNTPVYLDDRPNAARAQGQHRSATARPAGMQSGPRPSAGQPKTPLEPELGVTTTPVLPPAMP